MGLDGWMSRMDDSETLTDLERGKEDCVLRFADGQAFRVEYLDIRQSCPCAKCGPRQENEQRIIEFREECRRFATKWMNIQSLEFQRLGIVGDIKTPKYTNNIKYIHLFDF